MKNEQNPKSKQLLAPLDSKEVTLEELESLCYGFDARPRGCNSFDATDENDDVLF